MCEIPDWLCLRKTQKNKVYRPRPKAPNPRRTKRHAIRRADASHATSAVVELGDDIIRLIWITDSNLLF
jgi:hypothetical protein